MIKIAICENNQGSTLIETPSGGGGEAPVYEEPVVEISEPIVETTITEETPVVEEEPIVEISEPVAPTFGEVGGPTESVGLEKAPQAAEEPVPEPAPEPAPEATPTPEALPVPPPADSLQP